MICGIYARKSTEQNGVGEEAKSVARQIAHARAYAERKGWTVAEEHIYADDGVSGALFGASRPGLARLLNTLSPRPPFQALVMSEESRLGREQIETSYVLKQLTDANVRVFLYLDDRERTLDSAMDKVMLSLTNFGSEMEREKASQRTYDAMSRIAKAGHVTGGRVYGYSNLREGSHVIRVIDDGEAATVRLIFGWYGEDGMGMTTIAHELNAKGVPSPRGRRWKPSCVREILRRELFQGVIVWNKSQKIVRGGAKSQRRRDITEWVREPAPQLRIIPAELWEQVQARLARAQTLFPRSQESKRLLGRPRHQDESAYLLVSFLQCATCGGPVGTELRAHGSRGHRTHVPHYACLDHRRAGASVCANRVGLRQDRLDAAVLEEISKLLAPEILDAVVDRALAQLTAGAGEHRARLVDTDRELVAVQARLDRLLDALADGTLDRETITVRLNAEKRRKDGLTADRGRLMGMLRGADLDAGKIKADLRAKVRDVTALLTRHTPQARQMLRKLLTEKIDLEPIGSGRQRGYKFRGTLTVDRLIEGEAFQTRPTVVAPTGFATWWANTCGFP